MPGRKLLVRGNHDFDRKGHPADTACGETWMTLVVTGDPPLLVTHIPMTEVPDGTVNALRRLARARLDDPRPRAATTAEEIRRVEG